MKKMLLALLFGLCLGASAPATAESQEETRDEVTAQTEEAAAPLATCCYDCGGNYQTCVERCEDTGASKSCWDLCLARFRACERVCSYNNC
ncbi:hypothetical protein [Myxococcus stipitatus]|uniref:hypothetical protein n=1 Tax=Myxococcus stipitatus TaxID=83455 RepID=UPI0030CD10EC